jgi:ribosomal protein S27AE
MRDLAKRPPHELTQIIQQFSGALAQRHPMPARHWTTLWALRDCRTAAMGGHIDYCVECNDVQRFSYNSCRNRHCPKCGAMERELWIQARKEELLHVAYQHIVFTIPQQLNTWCRYNTVFCYDLLFTAAWQTLRTFAADPKYLGARLGATMVLHTWGQNLSLHPHVHCIVPAGGLDQRQHWKKPTRKAGFLFPVRAMSVVFKNVYLKAFLAAWALGRLKVPPHTPVGKHAIRQWREERYQQNWVVYAKAPFRTPATVVEYLGRYTHKVAISNHRIIAIDEQQVTFRYKDYRQKGQQKIMKLEGSEFLRRFCLHILPHGFRRMRHYGILSNFHKNKALYAARKDLQQKQPLKRSKAERKAELIKQYFGQHKHCPNCGAFDSILRIPFAPQRERAPPIFIQGQRK